jgi:hypothetical protein
VEGSALQGYPSPERPVTSCAFHEQGEGAWDAARPGRPCPWGLVGLLLIAAGCAPQQASLREFDAGAPEADTGAFPNRSSDAAIEPRDASTPPAGDAGASRDGGPLLPAFHSLCMQILDVQANRQAECLGGPKDLWVRPASVCEELERAVVAGRMRFEPSTGAACVAHLIGLPCSEVRAEDGPSFLELCPASLAGAVPPGGKCYREQDCVAGNFCGASPPGCPGICRPVVAPGLACAGASRECAEGAVCAAGSCRAWAAGGAACGAPDDPACKPGLFCDRPAAGTARVCAAQKAGGGCSGNHECANRFSCVGFDPVTQTSGACQLGKPLGATCAPGKNECERYLFCGAGDVCVRPGKTGDPCGHVNGEYPQCLGGWCELDTATFKGRCQPFVPVGGACASAAVCGPEGRCAKGVCEASRCVVP